MTEAQAAELISKAFADGMAASRPDVPFALENLPRDLPDSGSFALLALNATTSEQLTQGAPGSRREQRNGWATVKLWTPGGVGTQAARTLAHDVRKILALRELVGPDGSSLFTSTATVQTVGTDGRWYMLLVRVPWRYYDTV